IEIAEGIVRRLRTPGAFDVVPMAEGRVHLLGIHCNSVGCSFVGHSYYELSERGPSSGMVVVAVVREGRTFIPERDDQVQLGDDAYIIAPTEQIPKVMEAIGHQEPRSRHLVIVGGGNVGVHLACKLRDNRGTNIKIIEHDPVRAQEIAQELGEAALVINGDALDRAVLEEANVGAAGTIVAVTNDDETNIFSSVLAKRAGCPRAITLVNKRSYEPFMTTLGIDSVLSPSEMTISTVLRHVRGSNVSALYTLREGFGEVVEAEVGPSSPLLEGPLLELGLPDGMIIGAVVRGDRVIIPHGETQFEPGDHIVALVTYSDLRKAAALISGDAKVKLW
nr:Trk system potassium transporter TrkA [Gemmatimonadaceae bacterium]